jgi:hypothetical protein
MERVMNEALVALRRQVVKPVLEREIQAIRMGLKKQIKDSVKLGAYLEQVSRDVLDNLEWFSVSAVDEEARQAALLTILSRYRVNLLVDNGAMRGACDCREQPSFRTLFGSIEYQPEEDALVTDFSRIRAGSLLNAHGGFLMLHLRDLLTDEVVWEKLRRFLRNGRLQIEEPGPMIAPIASVSLEPEAVDLIQDRADFHRRTTNAGGGPGIWAAFSRQGGLCRELHRHRADLRCLRRVCRPRLQASRSGALFGRRGGGFAGGLAPRGGRPDAPERDLCPHRGAGDGKRRLVPRARRYAGAGA